MGKLNQILLFTIVLSLIILCQADLKADDEFMHVPAAVHISSTVSDGKHSIPEIIEIAKENGIKVIIFTDHDLVKWEYGL